MSQKSQSIFFIVLALLLVLLLIIFWPDQSVVPGESKPVQTPRPVKTKQPPDAKSKPAFEKDPGETILVEELKGVRVLRTTLDEYKELNQSPELLEGLEPLLFDESDLAEVEGIISRYRGNAVTLNSIKEMIVELSRLYHKSTGNRIQIMFPQQDITDGILRVVAVGQ